MQRRPAEALDLPQSEEMLHLENSPKNYNPLL
jgi:hypothetical protein